MEMTSDPVSKRTTQKVSSGEEVSRCFYLAVLGEAACVMMCAALGSRGDIIAK